MICGECPLKNCDEESLWCAFRWATEPNVEQQRFVNRQIRVRRSRVMVDRSEYMADYYRENRPHKLAAANARNARLRLAGLCKKVIKNVKN
jgi:hypothetical protein